MYYILLKNFGSPPRPENCWKYATAYKHNKNEIYTRTGQRGYDGVQVLVESVHGAVVFDPGWRDLSQYGHSVGELSFWPISAAQYVSQYLYASRLKSNRAWRNAMVLFAVKIQSTKMRRFETESHAVVGTASAWPDNFY